MTIWVDLSGELALASSQLSGPCAFPSNEFRDDRSLAEKIEFVVEEHQYTAQGDGSNGQRGTRPIYNGKKQDLFCCLKVSETTPKRTFFGGGGMGCQAYLV